MENKDLLTTDLNPAMITQGPEGDMDEKKEHPWQDKFIEDHGERLFYMAIVVMLSIGFIFSGIKELLGAGVTMLIQTGAIALNKMRSPKNGVQKNGEGKG